MINNEFEYTGIGTRDLHRDDSKTLFVYAFLAALGGRGVRSGGADGSDTSFEAGARQAYRFLITNFPELKNKGLKRNRFISVFLPWNGFNGRKVDENNGYYSNFGKYPKTEELAIKYRPERSPYSSLKPAAQSLMRRNSQQIFGEDCEHSTKEVICHTNDGKDSGGTGQAIRIAWDNNIPVYNYGTPEGKAYIKNYIQEKGKHFSEKYKDCFEHESIIDYIEELYDNFNGFEDVRESSLSKAEAQVLVHGCNCMNTMGSGVAKDIRETFPEAYEADCQTKKGDKNKLGTYSFVNTFVTRNGKKFPITIINAYTQYNYGTDKKQVDYEAVRKIFKQINKDFKGKTIAFPKIGSGLAGGCWLTISNIIRTELKNCTPVLTVFNQPKKEYKKKKGFSP
jgi:O-acetyl-ADP-ribose deacetylase (regulator of RNase III)